MDIIIMDRFKNKVNRHMIFESVSFSPFASLVMEKVNIVVADKEVVDFICPPEKKKFLDPECIFGLRKRISEHLKREIMLRRSLREISERVWRNLKGCEREIWTISIARGCYKRVNSNDQYKLREEFDIDIPKEPSIFVAFDRVEDSADYIAKQLGIAFSRALENVLTITLVHETFHAFTDLNGRQYAEETWFKIIEESLANYTAYLAIRDDDKFIFLFDVQKQPIEYRCWVVWRNIVLPPVFLLISTLWAKNIPEYLLIPPFNWLSLISPVSILFYQAMHYPRHAWLLKGLHRIYRWNPVTYEFFHDIIEPMLHDIISPDEYWRLLALGILSLALLLI